MIFAAAPCCEAVAAPERMPKRIIVLPLSRSGGFMRKVLGLVVVAGALMVSACNTVEGVGKDVSSAGQTVAKTADNSK
jgi:predicted small secreted protein